VSMVVACFGLAGSGSGTGPAVAGAFAILAGLLGLGSIGLGLLALRQVRRAAGRFTGKGLAISGMSCGTVGLVLTAVAMAAAFVV
jgi:hypothetical protein